MAVRCCLLIFLTFQLCSAILAESVIIQYSPPSLQWKTTEPVWTSELVEVLSSVLGYTPSKAPHWHGVTSASPFQRIEALVLVNIDLVDGLNLNSKKPTITLMSDVSSDWVYQLMADRTYMRFADKSPLLMDVSADETISELKSQYSSLFDKTPSDSAMLENLLQSSQSVLKLLPNLHPSLNLSSIVDSAFLSEMQLMVELARTIEGKKTEVEKGVPNVLSFRVQGAGLLAEQYKADSTQMADATAILTAVLDEMTRLYRSAFSDNVLILALSVKPEENSVNRVRRQAPSADEALKPLVTSKDFYDDDYGAIFNIIFLIMLIVSLSVFAIALGIWHMDPGRDSIIYRMSSQRMKKD